MLISTLPVLFSLASGIVCLKATPPNGVNALFVPYRPETIVRMDQIRHFPCALRTQITRQRPSDWIVHDDFFNNIYFKFIANNWSKQSKLKNLFFRLKRSKHKNHKCALAHGIHNIRWPLEMAVLHRRSLSPSTRIFCNLKRHLPCTQMVNNVTKNDMSWGEYFFTFSGVVSILSLSFYPFNGSYGENLICFRTK